MRNIWAIFKKEMQSYFASPIAYVVIAMFLVISGYFFYVMITSFVNYSMQLTMQARYYGGGMPKLSVNQYVVRPFIGNLSVIALFLLPLITMRLYAEEKKSGTIELLYTSPITSWQIIIAKFLAGFSLFLIMVSPTFIYMGILFKYGNPAFSPIATGYLGVFFIGAGLIALGLWVSSLTENQIIAGAGSFGLFLLLWVIGWAGESTSGNIAQVLSYISILEHLENFAKGVLDTKDIVFYLSVLSIGLFLSWRSVESIKWK
jgi:ABC-2 type transport system permease protein